ncbi:MAG: VanZ family protein [Pseudomonadota bacterium]
MKNHFIVYRMPVIMLCILIFYHSSQPYPESIPPIPFLDKLIHFLVYGLLGALFFRAIRNRDNRRHGRIRLIIMGIMSASLYGITDEIHQSFIPERVADIYDVMTDILGSSAGVLLYQYFIRRYYTFFPYHSHIDKIENFI